jgi:hypothetical protein
MTGEPTYSIGPGDALRGGTILDLDLDKLDASRLKHIIWDQRNEAERLRAENERLTAALSEARDLVKRANYIWGSPFMQAWGWTPIDARLARACRAWLAAHPEPSGKDETE